MQITDFFKERRGDPWMAIAVFALVLFGCLMIYSASIILGHTLYGSDTYFVKRQIVSALVGFTALVACSMIDYHTWQRWAAYMLGGTFILLISVFFFSRGEINGAHRWISLGGQSIQPSEIAKLTFSVYIAAWLATRKDRLHSISQTFVPYLLVIAAISYLMLREPDFGTLSIIVLPAIAMYIVAGLSLRQYALGGILLLISLFVILGSPYRRARISTFLDGSQDTQGTSYQVKNISIAVGSGGLWGLGFGQSKQKRLFLPEPHTDSIFAVVSEELGSVRASLLIVLFCFLIARGYRLAIVTDDLFGKYLAIGITTWFGFQAFINFGSMLHLVPLVGVPLPFVSYGGTSLIISLAAAGILLNIAKSRPTVPVKAVTVRRRGETKYA